MLYSIIRMYKDGSPPKTIKTGQTLEEAREHCNNPATATDDWFDGYNHEE